MSGQTITNYDSLVQAVQDFLVRSDISDATYAPELIQVAQNNIYYGYTDNKGNYWPGLRVRPMEKAFPGGNIFSITIVGGSGYVQGETITFDAAPAGGVTATGTMTVNNGAITGVSLTNPGIGYLTAPNVTITTVAGVGGSITVTITSGPTISPSGNLAVPADYIDMKYLYITDSGSQTARLTRKDPGWIYQFYADRTADNEPSYFARDGAVFVFGPYPDTVYNISGIYYPKATLLSAANETDWMVLNYPHLILYASLAEAAAFIKDTTATEYWSSKAGTAMNTIQTAERNEAVSGSPLSMTPG